MSFFYKRNYRGRPTSLNWKAINASDLFRELFPGVDMPHHLGRLYAALKRAGYQWASDEKGEYDWRKAEGNQP